MSTDALIVYALFTVALLGTIAVYEAHLANLRRQLAALTRPAATAWPSNVRVTPGEQAARDRHPAGKALGDVVDLASRRQA